MKLNLFITLSIALLAASTFSTTAMADRTIRCESERHQYKHCSIDTHGYVRLERQLSRTSCHQGRNWDYDKRGIWVDDNCGAEFVVEGRQHSSSNDDSNAGGVIAAAAVIALIAAAASADNDDHDHYKDNNYGHSGHSSYIPGWMTGDFKGYNLQHGSEVSMHIGSDGRVKAHVDGMRLTGYVNDQRLYMGDAEFFINRAGDGFNAVQVGNSSNKIHYSRN